MISTYQRIKLTLYTKIISNLRLSGLSKIIFFLIVQCVRNCEEAQIVVSQPLSCVWPLVTPWTAAFQASLSFVSWSLLKLMSIESVMPSNHLILCLPLLLLPSVFHSIRSFPISQLFTSGGQSIGASVSVLPMNTQVWFPLWLTGLISLLSQGLSRVFSNTTVWKFFGAQPSLWSNFHICTWLLEKPVLTRWTFVSKVVALLFNMLSRFVITFLPRSKHLLISWLQSPSTVILEPKKIKSVTVSIFFPIYLPWSDGTGYHDLSFLNVESKASAEKENELASQANKRKL